MWIVYPFCHTIAASQERCNNLFGKPQFSTVRKSNLPGFWQARQIDMKKRNRSISWDIGNNYEWIDSYLNIWVAISQLLQQMAFCMNSAPTYPFKGLMLLDIMHQETFHRSVYIYINYLLVCGKPVLSKMTAAFAVNYIKRSKLISHHNNITLLWLLASTPEFAIPLLSRFSSSVPVFCIEWSSSPRVWCHPAAAWGRLQPEQPEHTATASALLAGSSPCPLQTRSGLKCQLGNVDIWQTELSASLQAVWAVSQRIRQEA